MDPTGPSLEESLAGLHPSGLSSVRAVEYPSPPPVHWFGVLLIAGVVNILGEWLSHRSGLPFMKDLFSSEVVLYLWLCVQSAFVQRLEPRSHSLKMTLAGGVLILSAYLLGNPRHSDASDAITWFAFLLVVAGPLLLLVDLFRMRHTLEAHYTRVEPYGLSLNGFLLLFFGPLYLQYHLLKIAQWKEQQSQMQQASPRQ